VSEEPDKTTLKDVIEAIRLHSNAMLFKHPQLEPFPPLKLIAFYGGSAISNRTLTLGPQQDVELYRWENYPAHLYMTVLGVTMPSAIDLPYVGYIVNFDRNWDIADWTAEEYNTLLGLGPPPLGSGVIPGYGGCTLYNAVTFQYVCLTQWDYLTNDFLQIRLRNWTDVPVNVDLVDLQLWTCGNIKYQKFTYW
jgi:hypothetical protein